MQIFSPAAAPTTPERVTLLDNGQTVIRHLRNPARTQDTLVVTFAEMLMNDPMAAGFGEGFFLKAGYDLVIVQKRSESWYQDLKVADFAQAVSGVATQYRDVACYGISMGAFAALYFGGAIDASILALSPLCSIHPRFPQLGAQEHRRQVAATQCDLADAPKSGKPVFIVFDPRMPLDALYMREEVIPAFPKAAIALAPGAGHPVSRCLNAAGLLGPLVLDFVREQRMPDIAAALRPKRANSPFWLVNLADRCARRARFETAMSLCDRAIALAPDPAFFVAKRDAVVQRRAAALAQRGGQASANRPAARAG